MKRTTQADVEAAAARLKARRLARGEKTWLTVEYYNGWCHLHEVDAETAGRHCSIRKVNGGTKREMLAHLMAAAY